MTSKNQIILYNETFGKYQLMVQNSLEIFNREDMTNTLLTIEDKEYNYDDIISINVINLCQNAMNDLPHSLESLIIKRTTLVDMIIPKECVKLKHIEIRDSNLTSVPEIDFLPNNKKYVTVETTPQFLTLFAPDCYEELGTLAQMNPPIRTKDHQIVLWKRLLDGTIDVLGSDHAPHTLTEKQKVYPESPSGLTGVQTMLPIMLDHVNNKKLKFQRLVELLSINPCKIFNIKKRGEIREGYFADLTVIDMNLNFKITNDWIASRCGWTPFNDKIVKGFPVGTIVNGKIASWDKKIVDTKFGQPLEF